MFFNDMEDVKGSVHVSIHKLLLLLDQIKLEFHVVFPRFHVNIYLFMQASYLKELPQSSIIIQLSVS